jgi:hypothetical protein
MSTSLIRYTLLDQEGDGTILQVQIQLLEQTSNGRTYKSGYGFNTSDRKTNHKLQNHHAAARIEFATVQCYQRRSFTTEKYYCLAHAFAIHHHSFFLRNRYVQVSLHLAFYL